MEKKFTVPGEPIGKGRPRFSKQGNFVRTYTPEKTASYENLVKLEYERQCEKEPFPKDIPLFMKVDAFYSVPKSASRKKQFWCIEEPKTFTPNTGSPDGRLRSIVSTKQILKLTKKHRLCTVLPVANCLRFLICRKNMPFCSVRRSKPVSSYLN